MHNHQEILIPDGFYHVYNRTNGNDLLFRNHDNYQYFLDKFKLYIIPVAHIVCYSLLPNHFHFMIQVKEEQEILGVMNKRKANRREKDLIENDQQSIISKYISNQFSRLFNIYTQSYNKRFARHGGLFQRPFKRKKIADNDYMTKLIHYIHFNPVKAGLCNSIDEWKYSSYQAIVSDKHTMIEKSKVITQFDGLENFIYCHEQEPEITGIDPGPSPIW